MTKKNIYIGNYNKHKLYFWYTKWTIRFWKPLDEVKLEWLFYEKVTIS